MNDPDELHDLLLHYLDEGVAPVTAAEALARPARDLSRPARARWSQRRALVVALTLAFCVGIAFVVVVRRTELPPSPAGVLLSTGTGPCAGAPSGCGSPESTAASLAHGRWSSIPSGPLAARSGQVEVWTGRDLIVWGGASPSSGVEPQSLLADGAAYDPESKQWQVLPPAPIPAREYAAAAWTGAEMIVVGGDDTSEAFADAAAYDPTTNSWRVLPPPPGGARTGATAIWTGRQLLVVGGEHMPSGDGQLLTIPVYDPQRNTWSTLPSVPVPAGSRATGETAAWTGSGLLVWLTVLHASSGEQVGYELGVAATTWRDLPASPVYTAGAATAWTGSAVLVMGGSCGFPRCPSLIGEGASFDSATNKWRSIPDFSLRGAPWPGLWTGRAFVDTNWGPPAAVSGQAPVSHRVEAYDPGTGAWLALPAEPAALVGDQPQAVWTGRQLLAWGPSSYELSAATSSIPRTSTTTPATSGPLMAGVDGASAWALTATGLSVSHDGGRTWTDMALPGGVSPRDVASVAEGSDGELWVAVVSGDAVKLYHEAGTSSAGWSHTALVPSWPPGLGALAPNHVRITPGPSGFVTVLASDQLTATTNVPRLFVSSDGGVTFRQHGPPRSSNLNTAWSALTFITPAEGVVVAGRVMDRVFFTADGGASWSPSSIKGLPSGVTVVDGTPFVNGPEIELPVIASTTSSGETLSLYTSDDGGATFSGPVGSVLTVQGNNDASPLPLGMYGATIWVARPSGGNIYVTTDNAQTWTTVSTPSLPPGVSTLSVTNSTDGIAVASSGSCAQFKRDCTTATYFVGTTDGGQTWEKWAY